jgi:Cu/Ag efflux pump CusA
MSTLTGKKPGNTYKQLLHVGDLNIGLETDVYKNVTDGEGNESPLRLARNKVGIGSHDDVEQIITDLIDSVDDVDGLISTAITQLIDGAPSDSNTLNKLLTKITALQALINGDDLNLDSIKELADAIKAEGDTIDELTSSKVNVSDVYNDVDYLLAGKVLDARVGKTLKDLIDALTLIVNNNTTSITANTNGKLDAVLTYKTKTASHAPDANDLTDVNSGKALNFLMNVAGANTFTIPKDATRNFPIGTVFLVDTIGAGQTTFAPEDGTIAIRSKSGYLKITGQYSGASIKKIAANEWLLQGDITS